jgi:hypothetical protein
VFLERAELAFETLDGLIEFVRRIYTTSGGGDAAGGGGEGGRPRPPLRPEGGPDLPGAGGLDGPDHGIGASKIKEAARRASKTAAELELRFKADEPLPVEPASMDEIGPSLPGGLRGLADGAAELVLEFLRRYPLRSGVHETLAWGEGARRLGNGISRLGLWPSILDGPRALIMEQAVRQIKDVWEGPPWLGYRVPILFRSAPWLGLSPDDFRDLPCNLRYYWSIHPAGEALRSDGDPVDDLGAWPLPMEIARLVGSGRPDVTAYHLLSAVSGAPTKLLQSGNEQTALRASTILLFSASHILGEANPISDSHPWVQPQVHSASLDELAALSLNWMFRQWPSLIFPRRIEDLIGSTAGLRSDIFGGSNPTLAAV